MSDEDWLLATLPVSALWLSSSIGGFINWSFGAWFTVGGGIINCPFPFWFWGGGVIWFWFGPGGFWFWVGGAIGCPNGFWVGGAIGCPYGFWGWLGGSEFWLLGLFTLEQEVICSIRTCREDYYKLKSEGRMDAWFNIPARAEDNGIFRSLASKSTASIIKGIAISSRTSSLENGRVWRRPACVRVSKLTAATVLV